MLADVRRELDFGDDVPTVLPESFERKELSFEILPVPPPQINGDEDYWAIRGAVLRQKYDALHSLLARLPREIGAISAEDEATSTLDECLDSFFDTNGDLTRSGIVFTPHAKRSPKLDVSIGVQPLAESIERVIPGLKGRVGWFASSVEEPSGDALDKLLNETQENYKDNRLSLLVATKAFGMGIDKPNIRYVIHFNISQSIESYYQEAGRAGRDREAARCYILYCPQPKGWEPGDPSLDRDLLLYFHTNSFKGVDVDLAVLDELLSRGAVPVESKDGRPVPGRDGKPIRSAAVSLDDLLNEMADGEIRLVAIPFENDVITPLAEFLQQRVNSTLKSGVIRPAMEKAADLDELIVQIANRSGGAVKEDDLRPHRELIEKTWHQRRDEQATFKAVYRLATIGLVDDYEVDYRAKLIFARVRKRPAVEYVEYLRDYVARYKAPEFVRRIPEEVPGRTRRGIVRDCLDYLVRFVYEEIAAKRLEAIAQMEEAVQDGIRAGSDAFQRYVNTYFDSRYTEPLRKRLGEGLAHYDLDLVWDFIEETSGTDDNIQHLRGACDRLLVASPNNGALLLLRAFTRCLSRRGDLAAFVDDFERGWAQFLSVKGVGRSEYVSGLSRFYESITQYDREAVGPVEIAMVRAHATWLRRFNNEYLDIPITAKSA